jgi:O-acetyl-ADP-ribose deacetylase (regulator of RNase III)
MNQVDLVSEPKEITLNNTVVRLQQGDLTALPVDAFVYYARESLEIGSGFGTAIQVRGGDTIKKELQAIGRIQMGEAVITSAGKMNAKHIIHACGPKFQEPETERKLRECLLSSLQCAEKNGLKTIAFPPMGSGFYGIPLDLCATIMFEAIKDFIRKGTSLEEVTICAMDKREFAAFQKKFAGI